MSAKKIGDLVGIDLTDFKVRKMVNIYETDDGGLKSKDIGLVSEQSLADAYIEAGPDIQWRGTEEVFVITNGRTAFLIEQADAANLLNEEDVLEKARSHALALLSKTQRGLLGLTK